MKRWFRKMDAMDVWTAILAVIFFVLVLVIPVGAQSGLDNDRGTVPPLPPNPERPVWQSFLPLVHVNAFPQPMPAAEEEYRGQTVNLEIYGFHASYLLTARPNESSALAAVCWYGAWPNGAGAAHCDLYEWLGE